MRASRAGSAKGAGEERPDEGIAERVGEGADREHQGPDKAVWKVGIEPDQHAPEAIPAVVEITAAR